MSGVARRALELATLADVVAEAERLLAGGYGRAGNWSLAQCCDHLSHWLTYPVSGFPKVPLPMRLAFWAARNTVGRRLLRQFLERGMKPGTPTLAASVPAPGGDDAAAVGRLRDAVQRFEAHSGEYLPSPLFGKLSRDESVRVQVGHAAHHLGFLVPRGAA